MWQLFEECMLRLNPYLSERVWGGDTLKKLKNIPFELFPKPLGECWEVSTHKDGVCSVALAAEHNLRLNEYLGRELSYLVKFISCEDSLSVQVHPGDEYALLHENSRGKTECWLILDAKEGAGLYLGFKPGVTKEDFQRIIDNKENAADALNFYSVKKGDFFFVPHGSIHALGEGVTLVEIQQSSGVTYRVWDWNRVGLDGKPRELHVKKSFDVLNFAPEKNVLEFFQYEENVFLTTEKKLVDHPDFKVVHFKLNQGESVTLKNLKNSTSIIVLNGRFFNDGIEAVEFTSFLCASDLEIKLDCLENGNFLVVSE